MSLKPYLQLLRPANIVTAVADILAGMCIGQFLFAENEPFWLLPATVGLYGGGIVMNDVFDAKLDAVERPERPIPSGRVPLLNATLLGVGFLLLGIVAANMFAPLSGLIAGVVALLTLVYNKYAKHHRVFGPITMGLCRGGNLLLGMSAAPEALAQFWPLAFVPVVYIAAITLISQDEVHGGKKTTLYLAAALYGLVHLTQVGMAVSEGNILLAFPLIVLHAFLVGNPLWKAIKNPIGPNIGKAVKAGVLSLIIMNAAWCMTFGYPLIAAIVVLLLPVSLFLGKRFAVT